MLHVGDPSEPDEFDGMPNSTTIVHWARKSLGQACQHLTTEDAAQQFVSQLRKRGASGDSAHAVLAFGAGTKEEISVFSSPLRICQSLSLPPRTQMRHL